MTKKKPGAVMGQPTKVTPERKAAFLHALSQTCNVTKAATAVGLERKTLYDWRRDDEAFAVEWSHALRIGAEALEDIAKVRAFDGIDEPVFHQGEQVATMKKYSDTLTIFLRKGAMPEKYRERVDTRFDGGMTLTVVTGVPERDVVEVE